MKLRIISDLHVDINRSYDFKWTDRDILTLIAGDISGSLAEMKGFLHKHFSNVLFLGGNHMVYNDEHKPLQQLIREYKAEFPIDAPISFLENAYKIIDDVVFIGANLWTDYKYLWAPVENMSHAAIGMNDFRRGLYETPEGVQPLEPKHCLAMFNESLAFIKTTYDKFADSGKKIVLIVHHGVSPKSIGIDYQNSPLNASFISDLEEYIVRELPKLSLIIHGHIHGRFQYSIGKIPIICNPCGYVDYGENKSRPAWNKDLIVDTEDL
jgi:Icc-related predicted phosphoesterase